MGSPEPTAAARAAEGRLTSPAARDIARRIAAKREELAAIKVQIAQLRQQYDAALDRLYAARCDGFAVKASLELLEQEQRAEESRRRQRGRAGQPRAL
jgi:hypothetical protein